MTVKYLYENEEYVSFTLTLTNIGSKKCFDTCITLKTVIALDVKHVLLSVFESAGVLLILVFFNGIQTELMSFCQVLTCFIWVS